MRFIVVKDEADLAELRGRMLRPGVPADRRLAVDEAVRAANPHLDLDRLRPGLVLKLPDAADIADDVEEGGASGYLEILDQLDRDVDALPAVGRTAADNVAKRADDLTKLLAGDEVKKQIDADAALRAETGRVLDLANAARQRTGNQAAALDPVVQAWKADLAALRKLLRPAAPPA
jgi:hypothetical protein